MTITRNEVDHVARLARLEMTEEEMVQATGELNKILQYIDKLNKLDTTDVLPTAHVLPLQNVLREDKIQACLTRQDALANAPEEEDGMFRVPRVIE
ncbi:MAG: Asp-tRNA(Asn)/Glu-tRNA(Gln) amidotransferase subunit GatC [Firmicutes bacterium]|nr:Asp-tRNA(Asn)/Glu-tRNA(Gln) amidotransferase subunit GatC [Bacillota bacterium]